MGDTIFESLNNVTFMNMQLIIILSTMKINSCLSDNLEPHKVGRVSNIREFRGKNQATENLLTSVT